MNYRCTITHKDKQIANISFTLSNNDKHSKEKAIKMMDRFLDLVAKYNFVNADECSTNLYKEEWIEGI